ncbi:MAG: hypothetical protein LBB82_05135 [Treponema sp.]|jgi:hypothetical protein|nr:hypothetical protein [Treponema sp.]
MVLPRAERNAAFRTRLLGAAAFTAALFLTLWVIFFLRRPLILVGDPLFDSLYGEKRTEWKLRFCSLRLFRPVKYLSMNTAAGPDLIAASIWAASRRPAGVLAPYRYREGAARYLAEHPGAPVAVLGGRYTPPDGAAYGTETAGEYGAGAPAWFSSAFGNDLYLAGRCAALIALDKEAKRAEGDTAGAETISFYAGDSSPAVREAFIRGLRDSSWPGTPLAGEGERPSACAVFAGQGDEFFDGGVKKQPLILMNWADPRSFPPSTVMVFDDSPWAQLPEAFALLRGGVKTAVISSKISVFRTPALDSALYREIKKLKTLSFGEENADN